jgi:hypothetical protein
MTTGDNGNAGLARCKNQPISAGLVTPGGTRRRAVKRAEAPGGSNPRTSATTTQKRRDKTGVDPRFARATWQPRTPKVRHAELQRTS